MKTKYLFLGLGALLVAGVLWTCHAVWRAHQQLVTLNVRNVPLAEVLRKIQRQTWTKIRAEKNLDARITLRVKDKPLSYVLDRVAEQAGAHWSALYAVYTSSRALRTLESALGGEGKIEAAGWTKIAPGPQAMTPPDRGEIAAFPPTGPGPAGPGPMEGRHGPMMFERTMNGPMFMQNPKGQVELWSPEELVIESALSGRVSSEEIKTPTPAAAAETAQKVAGKWTTYFAFRKSSMGIGFSGPPRPGADPFKREPNDRFARLTPEQRVLRARQRLEFNQK